MTLYITPDNQLHDDMGGEALNNPYWPADAVPATEAQITAIQNPPLTLSQAQAAQIATLTASYESAISAPVSYTTAAGTTATFSQTAAAVANLQSAITGSTKASTWPLNLWLSAAGVPVTPFTYADLQGLADAFENADVPQYQDLLTKIAAVNSAKTVAAVQAINWPS